MSMNVDKETDSQDRIRNDIEEQAVQQVVAELKLLLERTGKEHALARYTLGSKVNELDKAHGNGTVEKLAKALGRGYSPDNLRMFARLARMWTTLEFAALVERGLDVSDFRELAKIANEEARADLAQQAIENAWPLNSLKKEVRKTAGHGHGRRRVNTTKAAPAQHEMPPLTVTDALTALITEKQLRVDEQARMREKLDDIDPQMLQALSPQIRQAIEALREQRTALEATERLLVAALQLHTGGGCVVRETSPVLESSAT